MGAPSEFYEQQSIEVVTPDVHIIAQGDDPMLLWAAGVIVPLVIAAMGLWFQKSHTAKKLAAKEKEK
jgi:hypothetical protein